MELNPNGYGLKILGIEYLGYKGCWALAQYFKIKTDEKSNN